MAGGGCIPSLGPHLLPCTLPIIAVHMLPCTLPTRGVLVLPHPTLPHLPYWPPPQVWDLRQPRATLSLAAHRYEVLAADWCK